MQQIFAKRILGWNRAKRIFDSWTNLQIDEFLAEYKKRSKVKHIVNTKQITNIPQSGSLLVLANHPTGIADGLLILDTIRTVRKDIKLIVNSTTYPLKALKEYTIEAEIPLRNPRSGDEIEVSPKNALAIKSALKWLEEGHCLVLFSNSEVDTERRIHRKFSENFWHPTAKKILVKYHGTTLPWAVRGRNSALFYQLSKINPSLKAALLPREGLKRRLRPVRSFIGKPFKVTDELSVADLELKIRLMSRQSRLLQLPPVIKLPKKPLDPIASEITQEILAQEISLLGKPLTFKGDNQVFLTTQKQSPNLLLEIGRLREITFRAVNEGSGKSRDLDHYDPDFHHLILWDAEAQKLVGAYRLGIGSLLYQQANYHSIIHDFYKQNPANEAILKSAIVMGRAFVVPDYQQKAFPLFVLWQGIMETLSLFPESKYLIGQTSLPNSFHKYSKQLITGFLWKHFSDREIAEHFSPYHPLKLRKNPLVQGWIAQSSAGDIKRMDRIIECIEPNGNKTPMLFKRYVEQNARCIGINIDPDFQNSIDILMLTKIDEISLRND
jgi:putative hemolysin